MSLSLAPRPPVGVAVCAAFGGVLGSRLTLMRGQSLVFGGISWYIMSIGCEWFTPISIQWNGVSYVC